MYAIKFQKWAYMITTLGFDIIFVKSDKNQANFLSQIQISKEIHHAK